MANTVKLLSSTILGSNTATVTISSIPQLHTDLYVFVKTRDTTNQNASSVEIAINGGGRRGRWLLSYAGSAAAAAYTNFGGETIASASSSNIFATTECYIPDYTNTTENKIVSATVGSSNTISASSFIEVIAGLSLNTAAVTSMVFTTGTSFAAGSLFQIYGIKSGNA